MTRMLVTYMILWSAINMHAKDSISVVFFLLDDCVICRDYAPQISALHEEFGDQVAFVGYFPNFSSKPEKIDAYRNTFTITFPLHTDYYKTKARTYGAEIMPEVIVYNHTTNQPLYKGRIDNKFYSLGRRRKVVTHEELKNVLNAIKKGQPYTGPTQTDPVGCYINYSDKLSLSTNQETKL